MIIKKNIVAGRYDSKHPVIVFFRQKISQQQLESKQKNTIAGHYGS